MKMIGMDGSYLLKDEQNIGVSIKELSNSIVIVVLNCLLQQISYLLIVVASATAGLLDVIPVRINLDSVVGFDLVIS